LAKKAKSSSSRGKAPPAPARKGGTEGRGAGTAKRRTPKSASSKAPASTSKAVPVRKARPVPVSPAPARPAERPKPVRPPKPAAAEESPAAPVPAAPAAPRSRAALPRSLEPRAHPDAGLSKAQVKHLHELLLKERRSVLSDMRRSVHDAVDEVSPFTESIDQAQHETEQNFRLRLADKQRKLLNEIDVALQKMEVGEYGICEGTEEPIGYARLEIRPWARYSVEYKELKDRRDR
jgi:DnaK suppressor protein